MVTGGGSSPKELWNGGNCDSDSGHGTVRRTRGSSRDDVRGRGESGRTFHGDPVHVPECGY